MIEKMILATDSVIDRSAEIVVELENTKIADNDRDELKAELTRITAGVKLKIIDEVLTDINQIGKLLKGNFIKKSNEVEIVEIDDLQGVERYGWRLAVLSGIKKMFDPAADQPKYLPIPKVKVERAHTVYHCKTNRPAIVEIENLLMLFLEKLRHGFNGVSVAVIVAEKQDIESKISKIDKTVKVEETFSEGEFSLMDWIPKPRKKEPVHQQHQEHQQQNDLFRRFNGYKTGGG